MSTKPQRRKIFPHLDESKKDSSAKNNSNSSTNGTETKNDDTYDNAKSSSSKPTKKPHPSARNKESNSVKIQKEANATHHLIPLPLAFTVLVCSGLFWIASFRDMMATGKPILDTLGVLWGQMDGDANLLVSLFQLIAVFCAE
jgi:hypothetical protein